MVDLAEIAKRAIEHPDPTAGEDAGHAFLDFQEAFTPEMCLALVRCYEALQLHKPEPYRIEPFPRPQHGDRCGGPLRRRQERYSKQQQTLGALHAVEALLREGSDHE